MFPQNRRNTYCTKDTNIKFVRCHVPFVQHVLTIVLQSDDADYAKRWMLMTVLKGRFSMDNFIIPPQFHCILNYFRSNFHKIANLIDHHRNAFYVGAIFTFYKRKFLFDAKADYFCIYLIIYSLFHSIFILWGCFSNHSLEIYFPLQNL